MSNNYGNTIKDKQASATQSPQKQAAPKQEVGKQKDAEVAVKKAAPGHSDKK
ncbi:MAG: hypothetical protein OQJ95_05665 [Kangiella sp.]|jgi:hypothetical protein|nr:hypothetical protein [Kangiella sp.]MCW9028443.1 hypothetical protein [Kangiella sp.]